MKENGVLKQIREMYNSLNISQQAHTRDSWLEYFPDTFNEWEALDRKRLQKNISSEEQEELNELEYKNLLACMREAGVAYEVMS